MPPKPRHHGLGESIRGRPGDPADPKAEMPASDPAPLADGLPQPQRAWAFAVLGMAMAMSVVDGAIVNIALPTISADYGVEPAHAIWIVNAYQLAIAVSLLPLAALADSWGYRRVYLIGLGLFSVASLLCALAPTLPALIGARILQGLGASAMMCVNIAIVRFVYPRSLLGQGVGNMALIIATSSAISPSVGAAILSVASWHWMFLVNVPIGAAALAIGLRTLPRMPRSRHKLDALSIALNVLTLGLLITGIDRLGDRQNLALAYGELAAAVLIGAVLVRRQVGLALPIVPIDLLAMPVFALSLITSVTSFASQSLALVALPFYLQGVLHMSASASGLLLTPWPLGIAFMAPIAGRLADRYAPGPLGSAGQLILASGLALVALAPASAAHWDLAWRLALCGIGFGFFQSPNNKIIIGSAPPHRSAGASGLQSTGRLVGQSIGAAVMAVIFARGAGDPTHVALWIACTLSVTAALVGGMRRMG